MNIKNLIVILILGGLLTGCSNTSKTTNEKVENSVTRMVTEANSVTTNVSKKQDVTSNKINNEFELVISDDNFDAFVDSEEHADLTSLQVYGDLNSTLISLNGIENLKNLKKLNISVPTVTDISALKGKTTISSFGAPSSLSDKDMEVIGSMTGLTYLGLGGFEEGTTYQISNITALSSLTKLEVLVLCNLPIKDYSPLYNLSNLKQLTISFNIPQEQIDEVKEHLPNCEVICI